jgi:outer membrane lipoprotein-sorting protein
LTSRRAALVLALMVFCASAARAFAADPPPAALSADDKALVQRATDYIQALKSAEGRFTQTDPKGHVSTGLFYLQRPGKARFQYDPPTKLLVVADGVDVSIYDGRLKSFDQYPLEQTPLVVLLAKNIRLDQGIAITAVDRRADGVAITARDAHRPALGGITLQFSQTPLALTGWTVIDAQGQKTEVKLSAFKEKTALPAGLFVLHDPQAHPH